MLARSGEITAPCPVPCSFALTTPSSRMPALSHLRIKRTMRRSPIRCSTKRIIHSWSTVSKEAVTHYLSPRRLEFSDDKARTAPIRGSLVGRDGCNQASRHLAAARGTSRWQPLAHPRQLDRLERGD